MLYYEHCKTVRARTGNLISRDELEGLTGFQTVYGYDVEVRDILRAQKNSLGLARFVPSSDCLYVDFDDQPEEAAKLRLSLIDNDFVYEMYDSGNRSVHFHIPHEMKRSKDLPHTHKCVLEKLGVAMGKVDTTLYRPNSLFRLNGTAHHKTGNKKVLTEKGGSYILDFNIIPTPERRFEEASGLETPGLVLESFLSHMHSMLLQTVDSGSRHANLFKVGCNVYDLGIDSRAALTFATLINNTFLEPKPDSEVERAIQGAYEYMQGIKGNRHGEEEEET